MRGHEGRWGSGATEKDQEGHWSLCGRFAILSPSLLWSAFLHLWELGGGRGGRGASLRLTQVWRRWLGALGHSPAPVKSMLQL